VLERANVTVCIATYNRANWLRTAVESVLSQTYDRFVVLVSDNASDDGTAEVMQAFDDPRVAYLPLAENIGRSANERRLMNLVETDYAVFLGDDDALLPTHLEATVAAIRERPSVGVVHTGCTLVNRDDGVVDPHVKFVRTSGDEVFESGAEFRRRSMQAGWTVCWMSALFRREAILGAGGLREEDGLIDDFPLMLRISTNWDFVYLNRPLVRMRVHASAASSSLGTFTPRGFRTAESVAGMLHEFRVAYLDTAGLPQAETSELRALAERQLRRDRLAHLSMRATTGDSRVSVLRALGGEIRNDPSFIREPWTWRFLAGQVGGKWGRDALRRIRSSPRRATG
jgi:glycosyltransferase involved in cell wall biosynthesis